MTESAAFDSDRRPAWWQWPNVLGIDAPVVAVVWLWAFARSYAMPMTAATPAALFLITWSLYLGDRQIDALRRRAGDPSPGLRSARHDFATKHRAWLRWMGLAAGLAGIGIALASLERPILAAGAMVGVGSLAYFGAFVSPLGGGRPLPGKELAGGLLIASGITVPVFADYSGSLPVAPAFSLFAALCALNCLILNARDGDLPLPLWLTALLGAMLTAGAGIGAWGDAAPGVLFAGISLSAGLLTALPLAGRRLDREVFHAVADALMLTPLFLGI